MSWAGSGWTFRVALIVAAAWSITASAKDDGVWRVEGLLVGKKGQATKDLSGIACAQQTGYPRTCVMIDDELQSAQVVTVSDGVLAAGPSIPLIDDMLDGKAVELDGEGVAFAEGYFYVIGSHGQPRHNSDNDSKKEEARIAARLRASSKLIRLKYDVAKNEVVKPAEMPSSALRELIKSEPVFGPFRNKALDDGGVTVEGIAVHGGRLYAGFRGPVLDADKQSQALIISVALPHFFDGSPAEQTIHRLALGSGRGVRDLAVHGGTILILAGPMQDVKGTYSIYAWDGVGNTVALLKDLPDYLNGKGKKQWKPEALLPLASGGGELRVLILMDDVENGSPREVRIPAP